MARELVDVTASLGTSPGYSYAAKVIGGTTVFTAGAVPVDAEGNLVASGDLEGQTRAVIKNLEEALAAAGVTAEDVVKTTIYVVGAERSDLVRAWDVFAATHLVHAPSTLVGVSFLGYEGQLVEIEAIAGAK
jgi:enamine deaminase RidA (YjgF/YER057c/UK114 family)